MARAPRVGRNVWQEKAGRKTGLLSAAAEAELARVGARPASSQAEARQPACWPGGGRLRSPRRRPEARGARRRVRRQRRPQRPL